MASFHELYDACIMGDLQTVKSILEQDKSIINIQDGQGELMNVYVYEKDREHVLNYNFDAQCIVKMAVFFQNPLSTHFLCRLPFWQRHIVLPVSQKTCHHQKFVF